MTFWTTLAAPLLVTALWVFGPGLLITSALRMRPTLRWALAPLSSSGTVALAAVLAPMVGLTWGPLPVLLATLLLTLLGWAARLLLGPRGRRLPTHPRQILASLRARPWRSLLVSREALTWAGLALAGGVLAWQMRRVLQMPDSISQTYDNIFHLSLVRYILDTGSASMLTVGGMTRADGQAAFYPAVWHAMISLAVRTVNGQSIPEFSNALMIVVCALVWPAGSLLLTRALLPSRLQRAGLLPSAVVLTAFPTFPLLLVEFGVLYPNLLGLALAPALLLVLARLVGLAQTEPLSIPATLLIGALGSLGLGLAHPSAAMALFVYAIPLCLVAGVRGIARVLVPRTRTRRAVATGAIAVAMAVAVPVAASLAWPVVRPSGNVSWNPFTTQETAISRGMLGLLAPDKPSLLLGGLLLLGLYAAVRHRRAAVALIWVATMYMWVAVASWPDGPDRDFLVGPWYSDPMRLAAMLGISTALLSALGVSHASAWLCRAVPVLVRRRRAARDLAMARSTVQARPGTAALVRLRSWALVGVSAALVAVLVPVLHSTAPMAREMFFAEQRYRLTDHSAVLTSDERTLIERIPSEVPPDAIVLTDAWNGSSLLYALTGVHTTDTHALYTQPPDLALIHQHLDDLHYRPDVCAAIERTGAQYALDFGRDQVLGANQPRPGWFGLTPTRGFEEVDRQGDAVLYRIPDC